MRWFDFMYQFSLLVRKGDEKMQKITVNKMNWKQKVVGFYKQVSMKVWYASMMVSGLITTAAAEGEDAGTTSGADIFTKAGEMSNQLYKDIAKLSTAAAGVCAAVCLFLMFFSKNTRTVEESTSWFKRIIVCWVLIMLLSTIFAYLMGGLNISDSVSLPGYGS